MNSIPSRRSRAASALERITLPAVLALAFCLTYVGESSALPISLFNTGVNNLNNVLPGFGTPDPHYSYTLTAGPAPPVTVDQSNWPINGGPWVPNNPNSRWIGPSGQSYGPPGNYTYATQFTLPPLTNLSTVSIGGMWASDDSGLDIEINNISTGQVSAGFTTLVPFSITSGFQIGLNTIEFLVNNAGGPSGLRVDKIQGSFSLIPEPTTIGLAAIGLAAATLTRRRFLAS